MNPEVVQDQDGDFGGIFKNRWNANDISRSVEERWSCLLQKTWNGGSGLLRTFFKESFSFSCERLRANISEQHSSIQVWWLRESIFEQERHIKILGSWKAKWASGKISAQGGPKLKVSSFDLLKLPTTTFLQPPSADVPLSDNARHRSTNKLNHFKSQFGHRGSLPIGRTWRPGSKPGWWRTKGSESSTRPPVRNSRHCRPRTWRTWLEIGTKI